MVENAIQVVLAVYDPSGNYSRYAGIAMTSLFSNTENRVRVTILHDATLTGDNQRRFQRTAERWKQSVSFIDVSKHVFCIAKDPEKITRALSRGTLFRLLIPDLLDVPKAIYLDCDVVVNLDIASLWNTAMNDFSLAAVKDRRIAGESKLHEKIRRWAMNYIPGNYFNAGVLLMNLEKIRARYDLKRESLAFFKRCSHVADWADQDFLNVIFREDAVFIEEYFNRIEDRDGIDNAISHFAGAQPWKIFRDTPRDRLFWRTFIASEWGEQLEETLADIFNNKPLGHYHSKDCVKLLLSRILKHLRLDRCRDFFKQLKIIFRELRLRARQKSFYEETRIQRQEKMRIVN